MALHRRRSGAQVKPGPDSIAYRLETVPFPCLKTRTRSSVPIYLQWCQEAAFLGEHSRVSLGLRSRYLNNSSSVCVCACVFLRAGRRGWSHRWHVCLLVPTSGLPGALESTSPARSARTVLPRCRPLFLGPCVPTTAQCSAQAPPSVRLSSSLNLMTSVHPSKPTSNNAFCEILPRTPDFCILSAHSCSLFAESTARCLSPACAWASASLPQTECLQVRNLVTAAAPMPAP